MWSAEAVQQAEVHVRLGLLQSCAHRRSACVCAAASASAASYNPYTSSAYSASAYDPYAAYGASAARDPYAAYAASYSQGQDYSAYSVSPTHVQQHCETCSPQPAGSVCSCRLSCLPGFWGSAAGLAVCMPKNWWCMLRASAV